MNLLTTAELMNSRELQSRARAACAMHGILLSDAVLVAILKAAADDGIDGGDGSDASCITDEIIIATVAALAAGATLEA